MMVRIGFWAHLEQLFKGMESGSLCFLVEIDSRCKVNGFWLSAHWLGKVNVAH